MHAVLERVVCQIESEVGGLDSETAQLHPKDLPYIWSAQQVIEHLVLSYRVTNVALESRLNKGRLSRYRKRTWLQWSLQLMILTFGDMPKGVPATEETTPVPDCFAALDGRQLADLLRKEISLMDTLLDQCRRKFGMETGGGSSPAWPTARGPVAPLSRSARIPPSRATAVHPRAGSPGAGSSANHQEESSGKTADTSPASAGLKKCSTTQQHKAWCQRALPVGRAAGYLVCS